MVYLAPFDTAAVILAIVPARDPHRIALYASPVVTLTPGRIVRAFQRVNLPTIPAFRSTHGEAQLLLGSPCLT